MTHADAVPLPRNPDLVFVPRGDAGEYVVKNSATGEFFQLGAEEGFVLLGLDGEQSVAQLRSAYEQRFGEALAETDLFEFLNHARGQGLLLVPADKSAGPTPAPKPAAPGQSALYWRQKLFDPDRLFNRLEPRLRWVWTPEFFIASALCVLTAGAVVWLNRGDLASTFSRALRWETVALVWVAMVAVTTAHEFAHGLTCKHHGGEVHEVGFLMMMCIPCFYCNVSDAWLIPEKRKRLWVTLAGGYCDLCVWALGVFVWRLTPQDTLVNYLAVAVLTVCGVRTLFNFNPLLKLDGYYLLSDLADAPNLQADAQDDLKGRLRWLLWGAARPAPEPRWRFFFAYGLASWLFGMAIVSLMFAALGRFLEGFVGPAGPVAAAAAAAVLIAGFFRGVFGNEVRVMLRERRKRAAVWAAVLGGAAAVLCLWHWEDRASGPFTLRPSGRAELRAEVAGFLRVAHFDEGDRVSPGQVVLRLEVPNLEARAAQKRAERREAEARLKLLEVGPRPEEVAAQRSRVERNKGWRDLARHDLEQARRVLTADLERFDKQTAAADLEAEFARASLARSQSLAGGRAVSQEQVETLEKKKEVAVAQGQQARAQRVARREAGTLTAEAELARRERELAESQAELGIMEAGSRPEEIAAEKARRERLDEELAYLAAVEKKTVVRSPVGGLVATPRVREGLGRYFREGELICVVEEPSALEAEISVSERDMARVGPGQAVELKVLVLPYETFTAKVDRVAPRTAKVEAGAGAEAAKPKGDNDGTVTVCCRLPAGAEGLRPGMTGHARISCGLRPVGMIGLDRVMRYVRTEFWW